MMLTKTEKLFTIAYGFILIMEMVTATNNSPLHYLAKPALLISLLVFFIKQSQHVKQNTRRLTGMALGFSLLGDILLMFVSQSAQFFTGGLVAFLLAHIMYILVFKKSQNKTIKPWGFSSILLAYAIGLFWVLQPHLGPMLLPVFFYMLIILTMAIFAYLRKGKVNLTSYSFVLLGAILFLISDSLLAVNKFYASLPFSNISIMFTYAFAQLFIVFGLLKQQ